MLLPVTAGPPPDIHIVARLYWVVFSSTWLAGLASMLAYTMYPMAGVMSHILVNGIRTPPLKRVRADRCRFTDDNAPGPRRVNGVVVSCNVLALRECK